MSTIVLVRKKGVLALAADSLWKDGSTMQRASLMVDHSKVLRVGESLLAFTGTSSWGRVLSRYFAMLKEPVNLSGVDAIFETVLQMYPVLKRSYGMNSDGDDDAFESSHHCLLVANRHGGFMVYPDRSVSEIATFYAFGSGYRYALGAMHAVYPFFDCPESIARTGVQASAEFDEDTGLPLEVHRIEMSTSGVDQPATRSKRMKKPKMG